MVVLPCSSRRCRSSDLDPILGNLGVTQGIFGDISPLLLCHGLSRNNFCQTFQSRGLEPCVVLSLARSVLGAMRKGCLHDGV